MSFDEFPPDSEKPRQVAEGSSTLPQETSVTDAPPASSTRRRSVKPAGSDAASSIPASEAQTRTRSSRTRQKPSETNSASGESAAPEPASPEASATLTPSPRPARQRSPRPVSVKTQSETAGGSVATPSNESAEATPLISPSPRPARLRRGAKPETPISNAPEQVTKPLEVVDQSEPIQDSSTPGLESKSRTRRPARSRKPVSTEAKDSRNLPDAPTAEAETPRLESLSRSEESVDEAETEDTSRNNRSRRQRPARNRRGGKPGQEINGETQETSNLETSGILEDPFNDTAAEAPSDDEERDGKSKRGRQRNRKGTRPERVASAQTLIEATLTPVEPIAPRIPIPDPVDYSVGAHLISINGTPQIVINDKIHPPILFFGNIEGPKNQQVVLSEVKRAADAGVHLHATLIELPAPLSESNEALDEIDRRLRAILDADPEGFVMPRIVFVPARGWKREYPTDIATYSDGTTGDPSITSERFWKEAEHSLDMLISHLREYSWGSRVFGFHLERGEWFQPADLGYDRSIANRDAFRDWLRQKYKNSLVALRASWHDGDVQFHTAEIPTIQPTPSQSRAFYENRRERRTIDFHEFTSESTAHRLISLAESIKKSSKRQAIVSVCYGYTFEFGHSFSGHLALGMTLASNAIDIFCGPPSYRDRKPGGAASLPGPVDSPALNGKLWLSEDDTKTYLSPVQQDPDDFNPRMTDKSQTDQAHARAIGRALSQSTGIGFMDLWGEGWLDEDQLWERIAAFKNQYALCLESKTRSSYAEVVCIIDEKSLLHLQRGEAFFRKMTSGLRDVMQRLGAPLKVYLQSDVLLDQFPTDAKLYLFLTPYRLTAPQRAAIKSKLHGGDRTLAWLYAPGSCEERPSMAGAGEEAVGGTVGITLRPQEWNSEVGSKFTDSRHAITERINSREIGVRERINPSFYADDEEATVLAEYIESGLPSLVAKKCDGWQSVFIGDPTLPLDLFRGICKYAGVHLWMGGGDDNLTIGNGWITVHANRDGQRTLRMPVPMGLYDLAEDRLIGETVREHRFFVKNGTTRTFCYGSMETLRSYGFAKPLMIEARHETPAAPVAPSSNALETEIDAAPETEVETALKVDQIASESIPTPENAPEVKPMSEDMQTLQAILNLDMSQVGDLPLDDFEEYEFNPERAPLDPLKPLAPLPAFLLDGEPMTNGRRRRRRGGRGRGRRNIGEEEETGGEIEDGAEGEVATSEQSLSVQTNAAENAAVSIESLESLLAPDAATLRSVLEPLFTPKSPGLRRSSSRASFKAALLSIPVEEIPESDSEELSKAKVVLNGDTEAAVSIQEVSIKTQFETHAESFVSAIEAGVGSEMDGSAELASNPIPEIREEEAS